MHLSPIRASFLFFGLRGVQIFNEVMGDSERAVRKMESSLRMSNVGFLCFQRVFYSALGEMRYCWTNERYQIIYRKRDTHDVKMVDSCSRENGVLCTVA